MIWNRTEIRWPTDHELKIPDQSSFLPRPDFNVSDGDTLLMFLSGNAVKFAEPCDDPWFSAHRNLTLKPPPGVPPQTMYLSDHLASPMGCVEQVSLTRNIIHED
jgi:hypothetical protein